MKKLKDVEPYFAMLVVAYFLFRMLHQIVKVFFHIFIQVSELIAGVPVNSESLIVINDFSLVLMFTFTESLILSIIFLGVSMIINNHINIQRA